MVVDTIHFDEVFDAAARSGGFSFRRGVRTEYGVRLKNRLIPAAGSTYAIAFGRRADWSSVLGWRDLATGKVTLARPTWAVWCLALGDIATWGALFVVAGLLLAGLWGALAVVAAYGALALVRTRRNRAVRRALLAAAGRAGGVAGNAPDKAGRA
jgi:hypothetical protein